MSSSTGRGAHADFLGSLFLLLIACAMVAPGGAKPGGARGRWGGAALLAAAAGLGVLWWCADPTAAATGAL